MEGVVLSRAFDILGFKFRRLQKTGEERHRL